MRDDGGTAILNAAEPVGKVCTLCSGTGMTVSLTEGCLDWVMVTGMTYVVSDVGACHSDIVRLHHSLSELGFDGIGALCDPGHGETSAYVVSVSRSGLCDEASAVMKIGHC